MDTFFLRTPSSPTSHSPPPTNEISNSAAYATTTRLLSLKEKEEVKDRTLHNDAAHQPAPKTITHSAPFAPAASSSVVRVHSPVPKEQRKQENPLGNLPPRLAPVPEPSAEESPCDSPKAPIARGSHRSISPRPCGFAKAAGARGTGCPIAAGPTNLVVMDGEIGPNTGGGRRFAKRMEHASWEAQNRSFNACCQVILSKSGWKPIPLVEIIENLW
ncbi:hypothetical protein NL676_012787 [Syzygium grande]|nr:hypothetical protein NL676_012787 [Syzygium grande]